MGKPRPKRAYTPELLENLRFRFEETDEIVREIAASVAIGRSTLNVLAREHGWTRFKRPPLDLTPAARLAAEAGRLAASSTLPPRSGGEGQFALRQQGEPGWGDASGIERTAAADAPPPPTPDPSPPLTAFAGGGEKNAAEPSASQAAEPAAAIDPSVLARDARLARLSAMARAIDVQIAKVRRRQALPLHEHQRREISSELNNLVVSLSQIEQQLQDLQRGQIARPQPDDERRPMDIDERRLRLAQRIREFVRSREGREDAAAVAGDGG